MSQYWILTPDQCRALMGGHDIPKSKRQRTAFASLLEARLKETLTDKEMNSAELFAGGLPQEWQELLWGK